MPRRGENIYKRKDGRWEGRILKEDGKYMYFYAATYREVKNKMKNFKESLEKIRKKQLSTQANAAELFTHWLEGNVLHQVKPSTFENYHCCIQNYVIPFFKGIENERLTEASVDKFTQGVKENASLSESYKKKILTIFKTALRDILKNNPNSSSIIEHIKLPKAQDKEVQVFSIKEQRVIEKAAICSYDKRALGIMLCFYTGIRLGELCALKWSDFDVEAGTMSITKTVSRTKNFLKNGKKTNLYIGTPKSRKSTRKIPLPVFLLRMVDKAKSNAADENCYVLSGSYVPIDPRTYQKLFKKLLNDNAVKDRKFHAIRHTFATRALELGVDIKTLSEILGHSNVSITLNIYAHSLIEQKKIAIEKFNDMHLTYMEIVPFAVASAVAI